MTQLNKNLVIPIIIVSLLTLIGFSPVEIDAPESAIIKTPREVTESTQVPYIVNETILVPHEQEVTNTETQVITETLLDEKEVYASEGYMIHYDDYYEKGDRISFQVSTDDDAVQFLLFSDPQYQTYSIMGNEANSEIWETISRTEFNHIYECKSSGTYHIVLREFTRLGGWGLVDITVSRSYEIEVTTVSTETEYNEVVKTRIMYENETIMKTEYDYEVRVKVPLLYKLLGIN